jgi:hypothetical protein
MAHQRLYQPASQSQRNNHLSHLNLLLHFFGFLALYPFVTVIYPFTNVTYRRAAVPGGT